MKIVKCSIKGMKEVEFIGKENVCGSEAYKIKSEDRILYLDKLPKVSKTKGNIVIYSTTEEEARKLYKEHTEKKIIEYLNEVTKLKNSIKSL